MTRLVSTRSGTPAVATLTAVALALALASPTMALAAKHDQLTVAPCGRPGHGCGPFPAPVTRGQAFYLYLKGYAMKPANNVLSFVGTAPCPSVYSAEANRERAHQAAYIGRSALLPGHFGRAWYVAPTKSAMIPLGNDYVCSYLKDLMLIPRRVTKPTYAHASLRLTVTA
jgi:hypothetical protein